MKKIIIVIIVIVAIILLDLFISTKNATKRSLEKQVEDINRVEKTTSSVGSVLASTFNTKFEDYISNSTDGKKTKTLVDLVISNNGTNNYTGNIIAVEFVNDNGSLRFSQMTDTADLVEAEKHIDTTEKYSITQTYDDSGYLNFISIKGNFVT